MHTTISIVVLSFTTKSIAINTSINDLSFGNNLLVDMIVDCLTYLGSS